MSTGGVLIVGALGCIGFVVWLSQDARNFGIGL